MNAPALDRTITRLCDVDDRIADTPRGAMTLAPGRESASTLSDLVTELADRDQAPYLALTATGVAKAQLASFPENLFWDFDFYLSSIHREAAEAHDYAAHLEEVAAITVRLMRLHGQGSTIRFRYVHDFIYGFDWARWVRRGGPERAGVGPFSLQFLKQVETRGRDILSLIEADDEVYSKLSDASPRNPFPFFREPGDELRLYRQLAEEGCIPVEAWRVDARPDATRDFDTLREKAAKRLGLSR